MKKADPPERKTEPVARTSADLVAERIAELRRLFPDVVWTWG